MPEYLSERRREETIQTENMGDKLKKYLDREDIGQKNKINMYVIVIGQCISSLQSTINGGSEYISKSKVLV